MYLPLYDKTLINKLGMESFDELKSKFDRVVESYIQSFTVHYDSAQDISGDMHISVSLHDGEVEFKANFDDGCSY